VNRHAVNLVGLGLIFGAAIGFAIGLIYADSAWAAALGAVGAGVGIVGGAILALLWGGSETHRQ
jgi:hypothetical protein